MFRNAYIGIAIISLVTFSQAKTIADPEIPKVIVGKDGFLFYGQELRYTNETVVVRNLKYIKRVSDFLLSNGILTHIVIVPVKTRVLSDKLPDRFSMNTNLRDRYRFMLDQLHLLNLSHTDAQQALVDSRKRLGDATDSTFFPEDTHWNYIGSLAVANALGKDITSATVYNCLPAGYDLSYESYKRNWDLRNMIGGSSLERTYRKTIFKKSTQESLLSNLSPSIVLIGTSYSRINFADAIGYSTKCDVLDLSEPANGFILPMAKFIKSSVFEDGDINTLIWEIPERQLIDSLDTNALDQLIK